MACSWDFHGVFTEYSYVSVMYRLCVGYVSGMCRVCVERYRAQEGGGDKLVKRSIEAPTRRAREI